MPPEPRGYTPSSEVGRHREDAPPPMSARPGEEAQVAGTYVGKTQRANRLERTQEQLASLYDELGINPNGTKVRQTSEGSLPREVNTIDRPAPLPKPDLSKQAKKDGILGRFKNLFDKN